MSGRSRVPLLEREKEHKLRDALAQLAFLSEARKVSLPDWVFLAKTTHEIFDRRAPLNVSACLGPLRDHRVGPERRGA